jgi:hypothetical protein
VDSNWEGPASAEASDTETLHRLGYVLAINEIVSQMSELKLVGISRLKSFAENALSAYGFGQEDCNHILTWY